MQYTAVVQLRTLGEVSLCGLNSYFELDRRVPAIVFHTQFGCSLLTACNNRIELISKTTSFIVPRHADSLLQAMSGQPLWKVSNATMNSRCFHVQNWQFEQEFACKAMGVLRRWSEKLKWCPLAAGRRKNFCFFICVIVGLTTENKLQKFFCINVCCFISEQLLFVELGSYDDIALSPLRGAVGDWALQSMEERPRHHISVLW